MFGIKRRERKSLAAPAQRGGWTSVIRESFAGAWQRNIEINHDTVSTNSTVFACMTLIAADISKLRLRLTRKTSDGIWVETEDKALSGLFRKPNTIQNRMQFWEHYFLSKLSKGNVYVLKGRDRGRVVSLHILDPNRVLPLVSPSGEVFYRLSADNIAGITEDISVPASEIIHDRMNCLFHPLIGLSPIVASGLAATQGQAIQTDATKFFSNRSMPGGLLLAPGSIADETAMRLKEHWDNEFTGEKAGKVAVLGDGLKYEAMRATASDSQMIEQLRWTAEVVCTTFHVPPYKVGVGPAPSYNNIQALNLEYYSQALQTQIEAAEMCLNDGLELDASTGTQFVIDDLLRMDTASQMDVLDKARSVMTLDERRQRLELAPIEGGNTVYMQMQDHSIEAIAARDQLMIEQAKAEPVEVADAGSLEKKMRGLLDADV